MVFELNDEEITAHYPVETWHSGKHILSLYYPIEKIIANYTNTFNVYLWMEGGTGTVDVGDCIASITGQAMAAEEAWDGKLTIEDSTKLFGIGNGLKTKVFSETIKTETMELVQRSYSDRMPGKTAIEGFCSPIEMEG